MTTRCTHCGATLNWYAGQTWQLCWACAKVTKRIRTGVVARTPEERERVYNPTPAEVAELLGVTNYSTLSNSWIRGRVCAGHSVCLPPAPLPPTSDAQGGKPKTVYHGGDR